MKGPEASQSSTPALVIKHIRFNHFNCTRAAGHLVLSWPPSIELSIPLLFRQQHLATLINPVDCLTPKWENVGFLNKLLSPSSRCHWSTEEGIVDRGWRREARCSDAFRLSENVIPVENVKLSHCVTWKHELFKVTHVWQIIYRWSECAAASFSMQRGRNHQVREHQILLSRQILDTKGSRKSPPQTRPASHARSCTVTTKATNECSDATMRRFG